MAEEYKQAELQVLNEMQKSLPVWVRIVAYLGFPIAISCVLLAVVIDQTRNHHTLLVDHITTMQRVSVKLDLSMAQFAIVLRALCMNQAKNALELNRCALTELLMPKISELNIDTEIDVRKDEPKHEKRK